MLTPEFHSDFTDLIQLETSDCLASEPGQVPNTFNLLREVPRSHSKLALVFDMCVIPCNLD